MNLDQQPVLLESTDPINEFIASPDDIKTQLMAYNISMNESLIDEKYDLIGWVN